MLSQDWSGSLDDCDVVWRSPSFSASGSMPTGNGEVGINAWVEADGVLRFYLARTDTFDEACRLLKVGRVRVTIDPAPPAEAACGASFEQKLHLRDGTLDFRLGPVALRLWVDAHHPVVRLEVASPEPVRVTVALEVWRTAERDLLPIEHPSAYGLNGGPFPLKCWPDVVVSDPGDRVLWYHRNGPTCCEAHLRQQSLEDFIPQHENPLAHNTFGGLLEGDGFVGVDDLTLRSAEARTAHALRVHLHRAQTDSPAAWIEQIEAQARRIRVQPADQARAQHEQWWRDFWRRSFVFAAGDERARTVTRGYNRQRFIQACAGRGRYPIKFNGSLFTVDGREPRTLKDQVLDADYRLWGGHYWHQNTRLAYWAMLASGDWDMMRPFFRFYRGHLEISRQRALRYSGHGGALFPETMTIFGTYAGANYGWDRGGLGPGEVSNPWIRMHICGMLETAALMLDYHAHTADADFAREALVPFTLAALEYYDQHYGRDPQTGKLRIEPSQSLETWQDTVNPTPDLIGLRHLIHGLMQLPDGLLAEPQRQMLDRFWHELPEPAVVTLAERRRHLARQVAAAHAKLGKPAPAPDAPGADRRVLMPAEQVRGSVTNSENAELYAVFPYRHYQVGKPDLDVGVATFEHRDELIPPSNELLEAFGTRYAGWIQDDIHAALLGLTQEASQAVHQRFARSNPTSRFPAFWGPNFDWVPDQDHGSVGLIATQFMLLQAVDGRLHVLPAWPPSWDVAFKLHAPHGITVACVQRGGRIVALDVQPPEARDRLVLPTDRT